MNITTAQSSNYSMPSNPSENGGRTPLVSVIIPTYNHAHYLGEAIQSVLQQTFANYEIIVVDDGSTDNTREIIDRFDARIRYIWQKNQGLSAARNTGLRAAKGELIGLLDADDLYETAFLFELVYTLNVNPDANGVYGLSRTVDGASNPLPQVIGRVVPPEELHGALLKGGFFPPLCMFAYKYCFEELGLFDRTLQGAADWDMWLRMSNQYTIIGSNKVLTGYRIGPNSMSRDPIHMQEDRMLVLRKHFVRESTDSSLWTPVHRQAVAHSHLRATIEFLQAGNQDNAYKHLKKSFTIKPDLIRNHDIFYRLGLGSQPIGYRGDFSTLDVRKNAGVLINWLDTIFKDPNIPSELNRLQRLAYANAYWAFGLISYGKRDFNCSRQYLLQALAAEPKYILSFQLMSTLVKSLLPARVVDWSKKHRQSSNFS
jgi:glycosyltransferase involved in cell wall biosynthesis